jgi:hypothetical protein
LRQRGLVGREVNSLLFERRHLPAALLEQVGEQEEV